MSIALNEIYGMLNTMAKEIQGMEWLSDYDEAEDCSGVSFNRENPDEVQKWHILGDVLEKLNSVRKTIQSVNAPVAYEETLHKNSSGRYEDSNGMEYTCGSRIEYYNPGNEENDEPPAWVFSRVEHDGDDYYIIANRSISLDGLRIRVRENMHAV